MLHDTMKSAFVAVIGRPSSGKSTLINTLCGQKVSIVAASPQTTRNKVRGILTTQEGQLVFIDTPGFHLSEKKFNIHMTGLVSSALEETDLVLYLVDTTRIPGEEEYRIAEAVTRFKEKTLCLINKIDATPSNIDEIERFLQDRFGEIPVLHISAKEGTGIEELKKQLFEMAPEGDLLYPEDYYTDQPQEFRISEIIREKAISRVSQEVPYALYVEVADIETDEEEERLWIRAFILVERESQKGIVVGKGGGMIKAIRQEAQKELQRIFPYRIHLDLRVKVNPKWRKKDNLLKKLIR